MLKRFSGRGDWRCASLRGFSLAAAHATASGPAQPALIWVVGGHHDQRAQRTRPSPRRGRQAQPREARLSAAERAGGHRAGAFTHSARLCEVPGIRCAVSARRAFCIISRYVTCPRPRSPWRGGGVTALRSKAPFAFLRKASDGGCVARASVQRTRPDHRRRTKPLPCASPPR
jgi:hypothetical protein